MMSLRSKLSRLKADTDSARQLSGKTEATPDLLRRLARVRSERLSSAAAASQQVVSERELTQQLRGYEIAEGVIQIQQRLPFKRYLGRHLLNLLSNSLQLPGEGREAHLRQVYVDTETTGLSGGSGTLAFLIGLAVVEHDALLVTQYLLTRFVGEAQMLKAFGEALTPDDRLVSYNGKSFDLPLLSSRYSLQRIAQSFEQLPHLDLLHPVRRLFGKRWPDCRLTTLEAHLLGFRRLDDLPGSEAPAAWAEYLRKGRAERLIQVVAHNRQDIVSLALAHAVLCQVVAQPKAHGVDIIALAQWLSKHDEKSAYSLLKSSQTTLCDRGKRLLAHLARRAEEWELAVGIWEELVNRDCQEATEQLAKYHEHVSQNLPALRGVIVSGFLRGTNRHDAWPVWRRSLIGNLYNLSREIFYPIR
jgi:uncharacterized protein YprB with RNaseH-like and TPR domain